MADDADDRGGVARRLRQLRLALGYTNQRTWASFLGTEVITPQHWNNYEKGRAIPDPNKERRIMLKTGATPDWIRWGVRSGLPHHLVEKLDAQEALENPGPDEKRA